MSLFSEEYDKKIRYFLKVTCLLMVIAVICYLPIIAKGLTNSWDGLWQATYSLAGDWQLSTGRWGWVIIDRLRGGYAAEPFNSILTLIFVVAASVLITNHWGRGYSRLLYSLLIIISTTVCCYLSYRFQSPTFGLSFLVSVIAAIIITGDITFLHNTVISIIISTLFLCFSLGLYQTNLGTFSAFIVIDAMFLLLNNKRDEVIIRLKKACIVGIISCVLYRIICDLTLAIRHITLSEYKGADSINATTIIKNIPQGIYNAYFEFYFYHYFVKGYFVFHIVRVAIVILLFLMVIIKGIKSLKEDKLSLFMYLGLFILLPLASSIYFLVTPGTNYAMTQMTGSSTSILPMLLCLLDYDRKPHDKQKLALVLAGCILLYGNIYAVGTDIDAMDQGMNSTFSIMESVNSSLIDKQLFGPEYTYVYVGSIAENSLFRKNELWNKANDYAKYGELWSSADCLMQSYNGMLQHMGLDLKIGTLEEFEEVLEDPDTLEMPLYPEEGSIVLKDNMVIIKISNEYPRD